MVYEQWLSNFTDWRPVTTAWRDFSIAESISEQETKETYERLLKKMKKDYKLLTELVMILNHKSFQHSEIPGHNRLCELYSNLFASTYDYACNTLKGDELDYFLTVTD